MRVIAGSAKSIHLQTPEGLGTRPTTARKKEALFSMMDPYLAGSRFLDLFSGSGAIGIEALSRGALEAVFVENSREALLCIKANLLATKLFLKSQVMPTEVMRALTELSEEKRTFDVIFMDPPYLQGYEQRIIEYLKDSDLLAPKGLVVFEAANRTKTNFVEQCNFTIDKIKKYKTNMHVFLFRSGV